MRAYACPTGLRAKNSNEPNYATSKWLLSTHIVVSWLLMLLHPLEHDEVLVIYCVTVVPSMSRALSELTITVHFGQLASVWSHRQDKTLRFR